MTDDYVQVNVRMTRTQRKELKKKAEKEETSMNQYIIDRTFDRTFDRIDDRTNDRINEADDRTIIELLQQQLEIKDKRLDKFETLLLNQQQLTSQSNQKIKELEYEEEIPTFSQEKKEDDRGFFSRLFRL